MQAAIPGAAPDSGMAVAGQTVTFRGSCGHTRTGDVSRQATWHTAGIVGGAFTGNLTLPKAVDPEQIRVGYDQGMLTVTMAKTQEARATRIPVRSAMSTAG